MNIKDILDSYSEGKINPARNWTEDSEHENGNYQNHCIECSQLFIGHKRRVICKLCSNSPSLAEDIKA